jgi:hypothetical protein
MMNTIHYYVRRDLDGVCVGEGTETRDGLVLADIQARVPVGCTALDAATSPRPPDPPPDPKAITPTAFQQRAQTAWALPELTTAEQVRKTLELTKVLVIALRMRDI